VHGEQATIEPQAAKALFPSLGWGIHQFVEKKKGTIMESFNFTWGLPELENLGFVQVFLFMLRAYAELGITRPEMLCIIHLASYHYNTPEGASRPSLETIAQEMGYSHKNRVSELVRSLEEKGLLIITRRPGQPSIYDFSPFSSQALDLRLEGITGKRDITEKRDPGSRKNVTGYNGKTLPKNKKEEQQQRSTPPLRGGEVEGGLGPEVHLPDNVASMVEGGDQGPGQEVEAQHSYHDATHTQDNISCPDLNATEMSQVIEVSTAISDDTGDHPAKSRGEDLKAVTVLETDFCMMFNGKPEFANVTQQREFRALRKKHEDDFIREMMEWAKKKGFKALKGAVKNPDNYSRWKERQQAATPSTTHTSADGGWHVAIVDW
jgi:hypothetical protein